MSKRPAARLRLLLFFVVAVSTITLLSGKISAQTSNAPATIQGPDVASPAYLGDAVKKTGDYYPWGQCTWYAWGRTKEDDDVSLPHFGNATDWATAITSQQPRAHSIAVWQNAIKGNGHVAYVEKVDGNDVYISEANFFNFRPGVNAKDEIGGGFDGCHIFTKAQMAKRAVAQKVEKTEGDLILRGYIYLPALSASSTIGGSVPCTRQSAQKSPKTLVVRKFTSSQDGRQVTVTFDGEGIQHDAKVIAQGPDWSSDEITVTSNTGKELTAVLGVEAAAKFTLAIQNPDLERSKAQELSVTAAPVEVSNLQPVPSQEPVSTPATAPDVPDATEVAASTIPEPASNAIAPAPESAPQQEAPSAPAADQLVQQPVENSAPAQSPGQPQGSAAEQPAAPSQPAAEAAQAAAQQPASSATINLPPILLRISPGKHAPGQFTVDLYGLNFQQGANIVVQGSGLSSDPPAVAFIGPTHLQATLVAQDPAQFTIAVQNPDTQTSVARRFVVAPPQVVASSPATAPATPSAATTNAPVADPSSTGAAPASSPAGTITLSPPISATSMSASPITPLAAANPASSAQTASAQPASTAATSTAPATAGSTPAAISARSVAKNSASTLTGNKSPISPLLPRGGTTNAGSTIAVVPTVKPATPITPSPMMKASPVSTVASALTSQAMRHDIGYCDRAIEISPPLQDVTNDQQCGPYYAGQCVAYAECRSGYHPTNGIGIALNWQSNTAKESVQPGDVVIFTKGKYQKFGHVAYVESVMRDSSGRATGVNIAESNNGLNLKFPQFPNITHICGATDQYGKVNRRQVSLDGADTFQGVYRPNNGPGQFLPPLSPGSPALRLSASSPVKAGDSVDIAGQNFSRSSRISLLLTAPGAQETFLVSFTSDANGGFHYPYSPACDAKAGAYSIRALDQAPAGSYISGRKSDPLALTVSGKATHCVLGIPAAVASTKPASGPPPILNPINPASHTAGQFSIDLYGSGYQQGAKVIVQSNGRSDQVSAMYVAPDHMRAMMNVPTAAQFTVAVQNPDSQISASQPFQVTQATGATTKPVLAPAITSAPRGPVPAPSTPSAVSTPANTGSTVPFAHSTNTPIIASPLNAPTPAKQPVTVNSTPVQPKLANPIVSAPLIKPTPIPVPAIKPMPQSNVASYPSTTTTAKPVLHSQSPTTTLPAAPRMPVSTVPVAPGNKPPSPPTPAVTNVRPTIPQVSTPHPTPAPVMRTQPQPLPTPVRVAPTPMPAVRVAAPLPAPPRPVATPLPAPRPVQPPPPSTPTKSPTPKKP